MFSKLKIKKTGTGPNLVLLHGWLAPGNLFTPLIEQLEQDFTLYIVDLPGYGENIAISCTDFTKMCHLLLDSLPAKASWLGWSLGGLLATNCALIAPMRIERLITIASTPAFIKNDNWSGILPAHLDNFSQLLEQNLKKLQQTFLALQVLNTPSARVDLKTLKLLTKDIPMEHRALELGLNILANTNLCAKIASIESPWLRLYGELDTLVPSANALECQKLATARIAVIKDAAHVPFISHPSIVATKIKEFLDASSEQVTI